MKRTYKKIAIPVTVAIMMCVLLTGCGNKKVEYRGSSYEQIIGNQLEEMEELASATENAKQGIIEVAPEASKQAAQAVALKQLQQTDNEENSEETSIIDELIATEKMTGPRLLPKEWKEHDKYVDSSAGDWGLSYTSKTEFLNYNYEVEYHTASAPNIGALVFSRSFQGDEATVYKDYTKFLQRIEANFKPGYGESYNSIYNKISDMGDEPYTTFYHLEEENLFVESFGVYDEESGGVIHFLVFLDERYPHHVDGSYGWALTPIELLIKSGNTSIADKVNITYDTKYGGQKTYSYQEFKVSEENKAALAIRYGY